MKMRELERRTGVNRETIRVYLRHGLLPEPQRPKHNVALYGEEHVRGILAVRRLQKDQRLPLRRIRRAIDGDAAAMPSGVEHFPQLDGLIAARAGVDDSLVPLALLASRNARAADDARRLEKFGAIRRVRRPDGIHVSRIDAELIGLWGDMRTAGYTEELGFTVDILKLHVEAAQALAHEELRIFLAHMSGQRPEDPAADMAQAALNHLLSFFGLIRVKTVLDDLRRRGG
jgi:DNA-binding transcriptional MerR regulator